MSLLEFTKLRQCWTEHGQSISTISRVCCKSDYFFSTLPADSYSVTVHVQLCSIFSPTTFYISFSLSLCIQWSRPLTNLVKLCWTLHHAHVLHCGDQNQTLHSRCSHSSAMVKQRITSLNLQLWPWTATKNQVLLISHPFFSHDLFLCWC